MSKEEKNKKLATLAREIKYCTLCQQDSTGVAVFGEGNFDSDIMFVGEAPGKNEAKEGRPFIGRSGKYLRSLIQKMGLDDLSSVYITSPVKYLPEKGTPTPKQIAHSRVHFLKQIEIINPKILVLMGNVAVIGTLGEKIPVKSRHGEDIRRDGYIYFITLHPAAGMRFPPLKEFIEADFALLLKLLKKEHILS